MAEESLERLSFAYREIEEIHPKIVHKFGATVKELDLSNNSIQDLSPLKGFTQLQLLVLDGNKVTSHTKIPLMSKLHTLWVNSNQISNLTIFIDKLVENTPNLKFLSMLKNEACPNFFNGHSLKDYNDYRQYVLSRLPKLSTLDSTPVTDKERADALRVYSTLPAPKVETTNPISTNNNITNSPKLDDKQKKRHKGKRKKESGKDKTDAAETSILPLPVFNTDNDGDPNSLPPPPLSKADKHDSDFDSDSNEESWTDDEDTDEWDK